MELISTYQFRIKDANEKLVKNLYALSGKVNYIWNYDNALQKQKVQRRGKWLTAYDLQPYTKGTSKLLNIPAQTVQAVNEEYASKRSESKKPFLKFRTNKKGRNLPWIPFKAQDLKHDEHGVFTYFGLKLRTWYSRELPEKAKITNGTICMDNLGHWFINITFKRLLTEKEILLLTSPGQNKTGIDGGLNPFLTKCIENPDGSYVYEEVEPKKYYRQQEEKLGLMQKAKRFKRAKKINKKIKNQRKDFLHKESTKLVQENSRIVIGLVDIKRLVKNALKGHAKSWHDNGLGMFSSMLKTKASQHSVEFEKVSERELKSTQTCSCCGGITGPKGLKGLCVSEWKCSGCGAIHRRNENSAKNHLLAWELVQSQRDIEAIIKTGKKQDIHDLGTKVLVERGIP
jgi:putative transposase